jgi:hypothetical protein
MMSRAALGAIRFYQREISPRFPASCRYTPTCSVYTAEAISRYGFWRGGRMGLWRILRCNPWSAGGDDPVR